MTCRRWPTGSCLERGHDNVAPRHPVCRYHRVSRCLHTPSPRMNAPISPDCLATASALLLQPAGLDLADLGRVSRISAVFIVNRQDYPWVLTKFALYVSGEDGVETLCASGPFGSQNVAGNGAFFTGQILCEASARYVRFTMVGIIHLATGGRIHAVRTSRVPCTAAPD